MKDTSMEAWIDKQEKLEALYEMERVIPMLEMERKALRRWVSRGNHPEKNPWGYLDEDGWPLNYVEAYRRRKGYSFTVRYHIIER